MVERGSSDRRARTRGLSRIAALTGGTYVRIRALAVQGPSLPSSVATVTPPGAMTFVTTMGLVTDSAKARKDKLSWSGTFAPADTAAVLDPKEQGLRLQAGPPAAPVVVAISAADPKWKAKKSKLTWKSAPGVLPKVAIVIDVVKKTIAVTASGFDYSAMPSGPVRMLVATGATSGGARRGVGRGQEVRDVRAAQALERSLSTRSAAPAPCPSGSR